MRSAFVIIILVVAGANAVRGPLEALLFYLWIAYFRPENWIWDPNLLSALHLSFSVGIYLVIRTLPFRASGGRLPSATDPLRAQPEHYWQQLER